MSGLTQRLMRRPVRLLSSRRAFATASLSRPQRQTRHAHEQDCGSHRRLRPVAAAAGVLIAALATARDAAQCDAAAAADRAEKKPPQRADRFDDLYETTSLLGCGMSGVVMQCVAKRDGHRAAVKVVQDLGDDETDECAREQAALSLVEQRGGHVNIVGYHGSYRQDGVHYLVTEYLPGRSLFEFIQQHHHVDVRTALQLTAQLASALAFLKQCDLVHRDVKPENIVILEPSAADQQLRLKLIDFGSAGHVAKQATSETMLSGTRCYWPPEVLARGETSSAMDMWALGCVLYILIAGRHPFDVMGSSTEQQVVQRIQTDAVSFLCPIWCDVAPEIKQLIRGLLEKDPKRRLRAEDVLALIPALKLQPPSSLQHDCIQIRNGRKPKQATGVKAHNRSRRRDDRRVLKGLRMSPMVVHTVELVRALLQISIDVHAQDLGNESTGSVRLSVQLAVSQAHARVAPTSTLSVWYSPHRVSLLGSLAPTRCKHTGPKLSSCSSTVPEERLTQCDV